MLQLSCSNYIFILNLTPGFSGLGRDFSGLGRDNCKTRLKKFLSWFGATFTRGLTITVLSAGGPSRWFARGAGEQGQAVP